MHLNLQFEALNWTFFSAYLPQPPLFFILNSIPLSVINHGILALRIVAALMGIGTTFLLYLLGKEINDKRTGLWASFLFTIYPRAIVYTRWAFPYEHGMFWILLSLYFCIKYKNTRSIKFLYFAGIATALALLTIYYAFELVIILLAIMLFLKVDWKRIIVVMSISVIPLVILLLLMFMLDQHAILFDLRSLFWRSSSELAPKHSLWSLLLGYKHLWFLDVFMFFGITGLFFSKREYQPYLWVSFFCLSMLPIARQGIYLSIFFYPLMICLPIIFLGLGSFIVVILDKCVMGIDRVMNKTTAFSLGTKQFIRLVPLILMIILVMPRVIVDIRGVLNVASGRTNRFANRNIKDTIAVSEFLNRNTQVTDLVIAPPTVYQFLGCHYVSLLQSIAYLGKSVEFYPADIPQYRFKYPCSYIWAKYLVIADVDRYDTLKKPMVKEIWLKIQNDQWQKVFEQGEFEVYINPLYKE